MSPPLLQRIIIGSDHAAVELKEKIRCFLVDSGHTVEDAGTHGAASVDYPVYARKVSQAVEQGHFERGILLCGTGLGMSMAANKFTGIRAALCTDLFAAILSRRHNDANVLVLGGRVTGDILAIEIVKTWLQTPYDGGRHQQRLDMLAAPELDRGTP